MRPLARGLAIVATSLLLAACGGGGGSTTAPTTAAATNPAAATTAPATGGAAGDVCAPSNAAPSVNLAVAGNTWDPSTINAKVGDVLEWTNADGVPHGVELDDSGARCTTAIAGGGKGGTTFTAAGTYPFHCFIHPGMKGTFTISA